jgi:anti-sigma factor ChrR (cupin superfamily)
MKLNKLKGMTKGWFVGDFVPSLLQTQDVEVAVKNYQQGELEEAHYHKIATEITVIISGMVKMNGIEYEEGDVVTVEPYESTDFMALKDTVTVVVKHPGAVNDKYIGRGIEND